MNKKSIEGKEIQITANYIGEDTEFVSPPMDLICKDILNFIYQTYPEIKEEDSQSSNINVYDLLDDIAIQSSDLAIEIYEKILISFAENLKDFSAAYYLTEPFLEIFEDLESFDLLDYLTKHDEIAELLFSESSYISDILMELLQKLVRNNDLVSLKKYINFLIRNRYFEDNPESLYLSDIVSELLKNGSKETNKELQDYLTNLSVDL